MLETGTPPLAIEETIEIISFIEAAYRSSQNGGAGNRTGIGVLGWQR